MNLIKIVALLSLVVTQAAFATDACNFVMRGRPNGLSDEQMRSAVAASSAKINAIKTEVSKAVIGQADAVQSILIGTLVNGHVLLEGVPGLAKTLLIKSISQAVHGGFGRIQFTPDLLPSDIVGSSIYNPKSNDFEVKKGPVFTNFLLADEINRAPPKVQAALLQAMQEKEITIGEHTFRLDDVFLVLATQNPVDQQGTYPLPEAQLDRFIIKVNVKYPSVDDEVQVVYNQAMGIKPEKISPVVSLTDLAEAKALVDNIEVKPELVRYCVELVDATRFPEKYGLNDVKKQIETGASPRASIGLVVAAKANAFLNGRISVTADDVKAVAPSVLGHRISLSYAAQAEQVSREKLVDLIIENVPVRN